MNIVHIISSIDTSTGGPARSVTHLITSILEKSNCQIDLFCRESPTPVIVNFENPKGHINFYTYNKFGSLKGFKKKLELAKPDILHGHGLWQLPVHQMAKLARKNKIPYIISPRGMLEPWALNVGKWKKKLALSIYQREDLVTANCIHATAAMEAQNIRELGFKNPIAVIPNGIDINHFPFINRPNEKNKKTLLFLSRIHPKKGIELLIEAWQSIDEISKQNWVVEIAGNGDAKYINSLLDLIDKNGLSQQIIIIGPQFGNHKINCYQRADLFVLPTYSENFGVVVAEALCCGVPVITTKGTPWEELNSQNAGWWIDIGVAPLKIALEEALQTSPEKLRQMGENGRKLVEEKYSIEAVAKQMIELYNWVLEKGEKPEFVKIA